MPKKKPQEKEIKIKLDLLEPQSNQQKIYVRFFRWLLSTGRYIIIFVEILVLLSFLARFKFDADLAANKEDIENATLLIKSLSKEEILIRKTQLQLATIKDVRINSADWVSIFGKIASETPQNIKLINLTLEKDVSKINFKIEGSAQDTSEVNTFLAGLKKESQFTNINLVGVSLTDSSLTFTITGSVNLESDAGKKL